MGKGRSLPPPPLDPGSIGEYRQPQSLIDNRVLWFFESHELATLKTLTLATTGTHAQVLRSLAKYGRRLEDDTYTLKAEYLLGPDDPEPSSESEIEWE